MASKTIKLPATTLLTTGELPCEKQLKRCHLQVLPKIGDTTPTTLTTSIPGHCISSQLRHVWHSCMYNTFSLVAESTSRSKSRMQPWWASQDSSPGTHYCGRDCWTSNHAEHAHLSGCQPLELTCSMAALYDGNIFLQWFHQGTDGHD